MSVPRDASAAEIKIAYHRALLRFHPDKISNTAFAQEPISVSLIKEAYTTLSEPNLRKHYDISALQRSTLAGPRPAQVVSLEEFQEIVEETSEDEGLWRYQCRCGGTYIITSSYMEMGVHLVGCSSCSEVVWAGYELQNDAEMEGDEYKHA